MESRVKIIYFFILFIHCNMLFYKKNQPFPYLSFIQDHFFSEIFIFWEEKLEHPLSGTTKKKNYQTKIDIVSFEMQNEKVKNKTILHTLVLSKWLLPEFFYVISVDPLKIIFLYGEGDEFGVNPKFGYYFKNEIRTSIKNIKNVVPSPDKTYVAVIENTKNKSLEIYNIQEENIHLIQKVLLPFDFTDERWITWDSQNRNRIYFYENHLVYEFDLDTKNFQKSKVFPECILPSTSFGLNIDQSGRQWIYDTELNDYRIQKIKSFKSFYHKKYISNPSQIQYQCF